VDPTGEFIVAGGKLAALIPVHSFSRMQKAIADKAFAAEVKGIPVPSSTARGTPTPPCS
jgi:nitrous-oxide reductase